MRTWWTGIGAALSALGLGLAFGAPLVASATGTPPTLDAVPLEPTKAPSLDVAQRALATTILTKDPTLRALLGARTYDILEVGPWSSGGILAGTAIRLDLKGVQTLTGMWPGISYDPVLGNDAPHQPSMLPATIEATRLVALVEFKTGKVVSLLPEPL